MYIAPALGEGHERDFLACGTVDNFKIIVFTSLKEYEKGFEYLNLTDYVPCEVPDKLFLELAKNDDAFSGLIVDIHDKNEVILKKDLL